MHTPIRAHHIRNLQQNIDHSSTNSHRTRLQSSLSWPYVANRHYVIAGIRLTYTNDNNQTVTIPVQDFYDNYIAAAAPLLQGDPTGVDVVKPFIDGLDEIL